MTYILGMPKTHGHTLLGKRTPEYKAWVGMRDRVRRAPHYTSRGITVCERWNSYETFLLDVGPKPSAAHWLERIDNDGNYEPGNCRWATIKEQTRNRRTTRLLTVNGETRCLAEWADLTGLGISTISARICRLGWTAEQAVRTPLRGIPA